MAVRRCRDDVTSPRATSKDIACSQELVPAAALRQEQPEELSVPWVTPPVEPAIAPP